MTYSILLYHRPESVVVEEIIGLVQLLTKDWFTANVPEDTRRDLLFQDVFCLTQNGKLLSFFIFTSWDGSLHVTLMGTHPDYRGSGLGSQLMEHFLQHARAIGFSSVVVLTVPPDAKPSYDPTVRFYEKHGFVLTKRYAEIWESGAVELVKEL